MSERPKSPWQERIGAAQRAVNARRRAGEGFLYAAEIYGCDLLKIGHSLHPERRVQRFKIIRGPALEGRLIAFTPATIAQEHALHATLREHRALGREYYPRSILSHPAIPQALREAA